MQINPLAAAIDSITLGPEVVVRNLAMIPLVLKREAQTRRTSSTVSTPSASTTSSSTTP